MRACKGFDIREDDLSGDQARELIVLHLKGMHANSPPGSVFALDLSGLKDPSVTVCPPGAEKRSRASAP